MYCAAVKQPSSPFPLNQQNLNISSGSLRWIMSECSSIQVHFLPSGPSSVWWWSWARSSWGENTESASCPPPPTGCSKAPSGYPGCICACHLSPVRWGRSGSALTTSQPSFNLHVWDVRVALPPPPAPASSGCERGMRSSLPTAALWSWTGSLRADRWSFVSCKLKDAWEQLMKNTIHSAVIRKYWTWLQNHITTDTLQAICLAKVSVCPRIFLTLIICIQFKYPFCIYMYVSYKKAYTFFQYMTFWLSLLSFIIYYLMAFLHIIAFHE